MGVTLAICLAVAGSRAVSTITPVLLVHGGAGNPAGGNVDDEAAVHEALREALLTGYELLAGGAAAIDGTEAAVRSLEDCALFNAGRGSVLNAEGHVEMDAAVMDGATRQAGACAGVTRVRHPVSLARAILEKTPHVLLVGEGAGRYAADAGLDFEDPAWFVTDRERIRHGDHGTVGAVALDAAGQLAAATSTGGVRGQLHGRVGDTPVIGAGTWSDQRVAVSCTGTGEQFIRIAAAHELSPRCVTRMRRSPTRPHRSSPASTAALSRSGATARSRCRSLPRSCTAAARPVDRSRPGSGPTRRRAVAEVRELADGLEFPEGPVVLPDGSVAVC